MRQIKHKFLLLAGAIFGVSFLLRGAYAIFPPQLVVYEPVELSVLNSILGLFAAQIPSGTTLWSIGILGPPLILFYSLDFIIRQPGAFLSLLGADPSMFINGISTYLAQAFLAPSRQLVIARIFVAVISAATPLAPFLFFIRRNRKFAAVISGLIFATSPFLVLQGASLMTDALGLSFFAFFLAMILDRRQKLTSLKLFFMGLVYGLSIVGKFPYMAFLPLACLGIYTLGFRSRLEACKNLAIFLSAVIAVVFALIPSLWFNPITLLKNIVGNLAMDYTSRPAAGSRFYWSYLFRDTGTFFMAWKGWLVFVLPGIIVSFYSLGKKMASFLLLGAVFFLVPLGFSHAAYTRYCMPLFIFVGIYLTVFLDFLAVKKNVLLSFFVFIVCLSVLSLNINAVIKNFRRDHSQSNLTDSIEWVGKNIQPASTVAVPADLLIFFTPSKATLEKWRDIYRQRYDDIHGRVGVYFWLNRMKLGENQRDNPLFASVFGSAERQKIFQYGLLLWYYNRIAVPPKNYDIVLYSGQKRDFLTADIEELRKMFIAGKIDILICDDSLHPWELTPAKVFESRRGAAYYLYINRKLKDLIAQ